MKHFVLFFLVTFFIVFNMDVNAKVEQSLNEYKIAQLQKGIDELNKEIDALKKDVDDTKEKKIENKKDNESLDKRIGDINGSVDRFGIIASILGLLITIGLAIIGFISYRNAKADAREVAKEEAENLTKNWINNDANQQLKEMMRKLQDDAKAQIGETVSNATNEIKQKATSEERFADGYNAQYRKEYDKAEAYYLKAIELGNTNAFNNLGILYYEQEKYDEAETYYLQAIEKGSNDALCNLGVLYSNQEKYDKAEKYYLQAIEKGNNSALNNLAYIYFYQSNNKEKALKLVQESYEKNKSYENTHTFATILLWNEKFDKSYEKFEECMKYEKALKNLEDISEYLNLLIAKGQYDKAKEYLENENYQLKDKLKPIWYTLMTLMQDENEIKTMGSELQTSVDDILKTIEELKQKYKI